MQFQKKKKSRGKKFNIIFLFFKIFVTDFYEHIQRSVFLFHVYYKHECYAAFSIIFHIGNFFDIIFFWEFVRYCLLLSTDFALDN